MLGQDRGLRISRPANLSLFLVDRRLARLSLCRRSLPRFDSLSARSRSFYCQASRWPRRWSWFSDWNAWLKNTRVRICWYCRDWELFVLLASYRDETLRGETLRTRDHKLLNVERTLTLEFFLRNSWSIRVYFNVCFNVCVVIRSTEIYVFVTLCILSTRNFTLFHRYNM